MTLRVTVQHGGEIYYGNIATIKRTSLGHEDHNVFTCHLHTEWPGGGVSVGGFVMDQWDESVRSRVSTAYGMDLIVRIMETVGVQSWEKVAGSKVVVLFEEEISLGTMAVGIANIDTGKAFIFNEHSRNFFPPKI